MANFRKSNIMVGTRIALRMDNIVIGYVQRVQASDDYGLEPVHVLNQLQCLEYVPTRASHILSLATIVLRDRSLQKANLLPVAAGTWDDIKSRLPESDAGTNGGRVGALRVLHTKVFDIDILDMKTEEPLLSYADCYYAGGSVSVAANAVMVQDATFYALDKRDKSILATE